uniref:Glucagon receptor b n=1 Tax=Neogobius melanostomus TaxID=47308 RepID=A0A8C6WRX3_9GOBI
MRILYFREDCIQKGLVCNRTFDQYACWPDGTPGTTVNVSCPWFLPWYRKGQGLVYRSCSEDGLWSVDGLNTSECEDDPQEYGRILNQLWIMYTVGYSLSLGALLLALAILVVFRKLHCMRNNIHMNLFASFILRAVSILIKDALDPFGVGLVPRAMVMMQYSVMANNYWLLVEGIYLHSLLVITVFSEKKYFYIYLAIGWGAPLIFVSPWITVKYLYENEECWERNTNMGYWWIIRSPILFAYIFKVHFKNIVINIRFVYICRLAKSTLTLIPLLGIHAILFTFVIDESVPKGSMLRLIRLFCDLLFNSFQVRGQIQSIFLRFLHVQSEMLKKWKRWKLGKDIDEEYRHTYSQTPHVKSGSIATSNLQDLDPSYVSPHIGKSARGGHCSNAPEENRRLVVCYINGMGKSRSPKGNGRLQFSFLPLRGTASRARTTMEDIRLEERVQCCLGSLEGEETSV